MVSTKSKGIIIGAILTVAIIAIIPVFVPVVVAKIGLPLQSSSMEASALGDSGGSFTAEYATINAYGYWGYQLNGNMEGGSSGTGGIFSLSATLTIVGTITDPNNQVIPISLTWTGSLSVNGGTGNVESQLILGPGEIPQLIEGTYQFNLQVDWSLLLNGNPILTGSVTLTGAASLTVS